MQKKTQVVGRPRKPETTSIRVHRDVADLVQSLAGIFRLDAPEFASSLLRPALAAKQREALKILSDRVK